MNRQVLQPTGWAPPRGYANGVVANGTLVFVAGQIGWNERGEFDSDALVPQVRQALVNVLAVLREAKAGPEHIVRMTWYVVDKREYLACAKDIGTVFRELLGRYDIAMSAVQVAALMEDRARVEIEVTAVKSVEGGA